ncbi:YggT family protein [Oceanobacter mangrovi]|uniref:YggT family protein n=1 Tax=Oceanobacter mangrovi TaxID=2862510 RepID=UPI001C8DA147|nr:YggT family protein [Oceanobacter mangrovi]
MSPLVSAGQLLINAIGSLVLLVFLLRFLLQLVRADFYNPISQFIVKFSNPLLVPLRRIIPGFGGLDVSSLLLAYGAQLITMALILLVSGYMIPWLNLIAWAAVGLLSLLLNIYLWGGIIVAIASWIAPNSYNPALILINQILEPAIRPIRNLIPPIGGIDLSLLVLFLFLQLFEILVLSPVAMAVGMPRGLAIGL